MEQKKTKELKKILKEELIIYQELIELSKRQKDIMHNENHSTGMHEILNKKDILISKIKVKEQLLSNLMGLNSFKGIPGTEYLIEEVKSCIEKVLCIEDECNNHIKKDKNQIYEEWSRLSRGKKITQGYSGKAIYKHGIINIKR